MWHQFLLPLISRSHLLNSLDSSSSVMQNYVDYAVNVSSSDDLIAAVKFAQEKNVRFVIRNTGHE